jgi:hypothetical protein
MQLRHKPAWAAVLAAGAAVSLGAGCNVDELLKVENPQEILVEELNDPRLLDVQLNGVIDALHRAYVSPVIQYANFLTDEIITGLNWEDYARVNQRIASWQEGPTNAIFGSLSRALRMAHSLSERIRKWAQDDPSKDFRPQLATSLAFAGYSALVLAENMCQVVISPDPDNPSDKILNPLETFDVAIPYLEEALNTALAVNRTDVANLARVGLARAHLGRGNWSRVGPYATAVPTTFTWWIRFVDVAGGRNPLQGTSSGANFTHGIHPQFMGVHPSFDRTGFSFRQQNVIAPQTDPRIQHLPSWSTGHNGLTPLYKLIQGLRYSDYNGRTIAPPSASCPRCTGTPASQMPLLTGFGTDVVLADYLEAQHHYYEALAMLDINANQAAILAFVNARRAVGNQPAVSGLTGDALRRELRNQRARDLFMGGFRVGDLRRWTRFDPGKGPFADGSYFPTGFHPNYPTWRDPYGNWTCYPIPRQEYEGNPKLVKPADPNVPPGI